VNLKDKVAVVTGAARGIGREVALQLAGRGADIAVVDLKAELCEDTVALVRELDRKAAAFGCNVSAPEEVNEAVQAVIGEFGKIDILVNNAGITRDNILMRMSDDEWDAVIAVNLKGVFNFTRAVARPMMKQRSGKIVNIASVVGITGNAGQANYSASKGGVIVLTKTTAQELALLPEALAAASELRPELKRVTESEVAVAAMVYGLQVQLFRQRYLAVVEMLPDLIARLDECHPVSGSLPVAMS